MKNLIRLAFVVGLLIAFAAPPAHATGVCSYTTSTVPNPYQTARVHNAHNLDDLCTAMTDNAGVVHGTGVTVAESGDEAMHKTVVTFASTSITVTDTGGANGAQGSLNFYTLPEGVIVDRGCVANLTTLAGAGGIADGAALVASVGTTAAAAGNATLTTTEADWIASFAGTLTAGAGTFKKLGDPVATSFDGHSAAVALYLNVAVPDADVSANDTVAVTGTITCTWSLTGDW